MEDNTTCTTTSVQDLRCTRIEFPDGIDTVIVRKNGRETIITLPIIKLLQNMIAVKVLHITVRLIFLSLFWLISVCIELLILIVLCACPVSGVL